MVRSVIASFILLLLTAGCAASGGVYEIKPPNDPDMHVVGYTVQPRFTGYELTFGIPALAPIPIIGPALAEAIRFRAGKNDIVVIPIMHEDQYKLRRPINESHNSGYTSGVRRVPPVVRVIPASGN
jgi:hypothetical protein